MKITAPVQDKAKPKALISMGSMAMDAGMADSRRGGLESHPATPCILQDGASQGRRFAFPGGGMLVRTALIGAAMATMVAGCATGTSEKDVRARPPMRLNTQAKMADVAKCLRNNLGDEATLVQLPAKNQIEIRIGQSAASGEYLYAYLISLTAQADGTALELRKTDTWFPQLTPAELEAEAKACARS